MAILQAQDDARVQDLVPIRYGRMSASAFAVSTAGRLTTFPHRYTEP